MGQPIAPLNFFSPTKQVLSNTSGYRGDSDAPARPGDVPSAPLGGVAYGMPVGMAEPPSGGDGTMLRPLNAGWPPGGLPTGPLAAPAPVPYQAPAPMPPMPGGRPAKRAVLCGCNYAYEPFCFLNPVGLIPLHPPPPFTVESCFEVVSVPGQQCKTEGGRWGSCPIPLNFPVHAHMCACVRALCRPQIWIIFLYAGAK